MVRQLFAVATLMLAGCAPETLGVLDPGPARDSGSSSSDATIDAAKDSGADVVPSGDGNPVSDATEDSPPQPDASSCTRVGADAACLPPVGCLGEPGPCTFAGQCCSLACLASGGPMGSCGEGPACASAGAPCPTAAACCSNVCTGGQCGMSSAMCKPAGEACGGNPECCGQVCSGGHCALLEGCRVQGEVCGSSSDCCSSVCNLDPQSVGHCAALPMCMGNDKAGCSKQVGEICGGNNDCCSRDCVMLPGGLKRCAPLGGCRVECELCSSNADCCSGACGGPDGAMGICQPASTLMCGAGGETCGGNPDCCAGQTCVPLPSPAGLHRCEGLVGDGGCHAASTSCTQPSECCSGVCLEGAAGFACASTCVADGQACTSNADCCGTSSSCLVVHGTLTCEPDLP